MLQTRPPCLNKGLGMCMKICGEGGKLLRGWRGLCRCREREQTRRIGGEGDELMGGNSIGAERRTVAMFAAVVCTRKNKVKRAKKKSEYFLSYFMLYTWAVSYWPILPSQPTSGLSIVFWQGLVGCLLSLPSQSTLLQSSYEFLQYLFALLPSHSHLKHLQHCFSALIFFRGIWGAEIARTSCAGLYWVIKL